MKTVKKENAKKLFLKKKTLVILNNKKLDTLKGGKALQDDHITGCPTNSATIAF